MPESQDITSNDEPKKNGNSHSTSIVLTPPDSYKPAYDSYDPIMSSLDTKPLGGTPTKDTPIRKSHTFLKCLGDNLITMATFGGVIAGIALGFGLKGVRDWSKREIMYINFPGELFLSMLKCLILPLISASLIAAIGSLDTRLTGKIGFRAVAYYMITTVLAIILGIILVVSIRPGVGGNGETDVDLKNPTKPTLAEDTLMDLVRNMFPSNIMEACIHQYSTVLEKPEDFNATDNSTDDYREWAWRGQMGGSTNILGIVVFSVVLGITLGRMKTEGRPLLDVFVSLSAAIMLITKLVIWLSPVGVLFLVASKILEMKDVSVVAGQVGLYSLTVLAGLLVHGLLVLPLLYLVLVRRNPYSFLAGMAQAMATAFGTASSSATLPVTMHCLEERNGVDARVSRFCLPIGATINMDGTALYEAVAALFIAQVRGVALSVGSIVAISITATAASIGAAGIPQAGLVTMVMVLNVVGLPAEDVTLILVVDWILDRFRTTINVLGDAYGSAIVAHFSRDDLADMPSEDLNLEMTTL